MSEVKDWPGRGAKISPEHQITIPVAAMRAAGMAVGDRVRVAAVGPGTITFELAADPVAEYAGMFTGRADRDVIESLRDEWD